MQFPPHHSKLVDHYFVANSFFLKEIEFAVKSNTPSYVLRSLISAKCLSFLIFLLIVIANNVTIKSLLLAPATVLFHKASTTLYKLSYARGMTHIARRNFRR